MGTHPIFESDFDCLTEHYVRLSPGYSTELVLRNEKMDWIKKDLAVGAGASNLVFNEKIKKLREQGEVIHHLGFGQCPFPLPQLAVDECRTHAWRSTYAPIQGIKPLREEIVKFHQKLDGINHFTESDVICGPGSKELIYLTMTALTTELILLDPAWPSYAPQARLANKKIRLIERLPTAQWKLTAAQLDEELSASPVPPRSMLILTNPDNPTGCTYTESELQELGQVCRKHQLIVLSDEIYAICGFNGHKNISMTNYYPEGSILCSGISKWCGGGGWRLGYMMFPKELNALLQAIIRAAGQTYATVSEPIQWATIKLMEFGPDIANYNSHFRRVLGAVADHAYESLIEVGVDVKRSQAGFYLFPNFEKCRAKLEAKGVKTGQDMCDLLFDEKRIALMPGGPSFLRPESELSTRLCYIDFDGGEAIRQSELVGLDCELPDDFVKQAVPSMYEAMEKLKAFVISNS